jgi:deazaflavin-dependent oxidoreductase (nitroreductase family)
MYRRTDGKILSRMRGRPTLLLTTTGRRSGRPHTVPLPYLADGDAMIVVGSASGAERHPAWVLNLIANPSVIVQYLADSGPAHAEILAGDECKAMWERINVEAPWYAGYQQRTSREIPLIRLTRAPESYAAAASERR